MMILIKFSMDIIKHSILPEKYATQLHKIGIDECEMMEDGSPNGEVFFSKTK